MTEVDHAKAGELVGGEIRGKLRALRVAITTRLAMEGLAWVLLSMVAVVFVTLAADYLLRLERPLRALMMAAAAAALLVVGWRQLVAPFRVPMGSGDLALLVEKRFGQLGDRLISAIQFSQADDIDALGLSRAMIDRMAAEAGSLAGPLPFKDLVERRGARRSWAAALCGIALLAGFGVWQGEILQRWFSRNVLFAEIAWPQETYLTVHGDPEDFTVVRGDDLTVIVDVDPNSAVTPSHVTIYARFAAVGRMQKTIEPVRGNPKRFEFVFPAVAEEFEFYVIGGDDRRDARHPHQVTLIDPPVLRKVLFSIESPSYMNRSAPDEVPGSLGTLGVPIGARVTITAESNKPLASCKILLDGVTEPGWEMHRQRAQRGKDVVTLPKTYTGSFLVRGENVPATKVLRFELTDTEDHVSRRGAKYMLQLQPDHTPTVDLKKFGIGGEISPRALIPLRLRVKDDHGIAGAAVTVRRSTDPNVAGAESVALAPDIRAELDTTHELDIEPLGLAPGEQIVVMARARDTLPAADFGGPNIGESGAVRLRVIRAEDLMEKLVHRQKQLRLEFFQAVKLQETARGKTASAGSLFEAGQVNAEGRRLMETSAGLQQSVASEVAKAADTLDAILDEMKNNRVGTETQREQMRSELVKPLRQLTDPIRQVASSIAATRSVEEAGELTDRARAIEGIQQDVFDQMNDVLERMTKIASKQEMANRLQLIIQWSEDLLESIKKKGKAEADTVFDPTTRPSSERE